MKRCFSFESAIKNRWKALMTLETRLIRKSYQNRRKALMTLGTRLEEAVLSCLRTGGCIMAAYFKTKTHLLKQLRKILRGLNYYADYIYSSVCSHTVNLFKNKLFSLILYHSIL